MVGYRGPRGRQLDLELRKLDMTVKRVSFSAGPFLVSVLVALVIVLLLFFVFATWTISSPGKHGTPGMVNPAQKSR